MEAIIQRIKDKSRPFPFKKEDRNRDRIIDTNTDKMQDSPGLRNWAVKQNLQIASEAVRIIQASGFSSLEAVDKELEKVTLSYEDNRSTIVQIEDRMRHLSEIMETVAAYKKTKKVRDAYANAKDKEAFLQNHETDISIYEASSKQLKKMGYEKLPTFSKLKAEYDALLKEKAKYEKDYKADKARIAELSSVKKKVEDFLERDVQRRKVKMKEELD